MIEVTIAPEQVFTDGWRVYAGPDRIARGVSRKVAERIARDVERTGQCEEVQHVTAGGGVWSVVQCSRIAHHPGDCAFDGEVA